MSSPRHSPPPSAAAPKPKGILKNASVSSGTSGGQVGQGAVGEEGSALSTSPGPAPRRESAGDAVPAMTSEEAGGHLAWDESNLTLHEIQREQQAARMKIDEPKTPFVRSASFGSVDDDGGFNLDGSQGQSYFPGDASSSGPSGTSGTGSRRSSAAEELAANTKANAGLGASNTASASGLTASAPAPAIGLDDVDVESKRQNNNARRGESRSPSFTLPSSRRSSAAGERSREGVREEMRARDGAAGQDAMEGVVGDDDAEDGDLDPESKAKQDAFARKRNAHYGNEAEAMKIAAALANQDDDEDDEDDDGDASMQTGGQIPPVPSLPNGRGA